MYALLGRTLSDRYTSSDDAPLCEVYLECAVATAGLDELPEARTTLTVGCVAVPYLVLKDASRALLTFDCDAVRQ